MALRARHNVLLSLCLSLAIAFASGQQVLLHDASQQYLQRSGTVDVGPWGVAAAACSACKLAAPKKAASGSTAADQVRRRDTWSSAAQEQPCPVLALQLGATNLQAKDIVTSDAFRAPRALVVLNVVGAEGEPAQPAVTTPAADSSRACLIQHTVLLLQAPHSRKSSAQPLRGATPCGGRPARQQWVHRTGCSWGTTWQQPTRMCA
jgi:hypothetical protein